MTTAPRQPSRRGFFFGKQNKIFDRRFLCVMKMRIDLRNRWECLCTNWMSRNNFFHSLEIMQFNPFFFFHFNFIPFPPSLFCVHNTIQHINLNSTSHLHSHCSSIIHTLLTGHYDPPQHNAHPLGCSESDTHSTSFSSFLWPKASVMCTFEFWTHFFLLKSVNLQ